MVLDYVTGIFVAPRTGAWIETLAHDGGTYPLAVAPRTGAWIETRLPSYSFSLPIGRAPYGRVD